MKPYTNLNQVEENIRYFCALKGISVDFIGNEAIFDLLSERDLDILLNLLKRKLRLQKEIFKLQGGNLDNVIFLDSYRK